MAVPQKTLIAALAMIILAAAAAAFILTGGAPVGAQDQNNQAQDTPGQTEPEACSDTPVAVYGKDDGAKRLALERLEGGRTVGALSYEAPGPRQP